MNDHQPRRAITDITLVVLAIASLTCLISLMALFMGGGQQGRDLSGLMLLQAGITPIAIGIAIVNAWGKGMGALWRATPQWLVFIFLMLNSLVLFGEIAFVIVMRATDEVIPWQAHVPLACMFACSTAYLIIYARANSYPGSPPAMSGRWT